MLLATCYKQNIFVFNGMYFFMPKEDKEPVEGDWADEDDEDFDDEAENTQDLEEIYEAAEDVDIAPGDDDHLPEEELQ